MRAIGSTVTQRLRLLVLLLVGLMLVAVAIGAGSVISASGNVQTLADVNGPAADANTQILQTLTDAETGLRGYDASHNPVFLAPFNGAQKRATAEQAALASALRHEGPSWRQLLAAQDSAIASWWRYANDGRAMVGSGGRLDLVYGKRLFDDVRSTNAAVEDRIRTARVAARHAASAQMRDALILLISSAIIATALALYFGWSIARSMTDSIDALRRVVHAQRLGDRDALASEADGPVDVRELAADVNHLTDTTRRLEDQQRHAISMQEMTLELADRLRSDISPGDALAITAELLAKATGTIGAVFVRTADTGGDDLGRVRQKWSLAACSPEGALEESRIVLLPPVSKESLARRFWRAGRLLETSDLAHDEDLMRHPFVRSIAEQTSAGALLGTPLGVGDKVIGALLLIAPEPHAWTPEERSALQQATAYSARAFIEAEQLIRQAEHVARLEALDRQKDDFVGTVSHELRTPLTSIAGYLELLEDGDFGELTSAQRKVTDIISRNTSRLRGLIEDVLVLNRIETRGLDPSFRPLDLGATIRDVVQDLQPQAAENRVDLRISSLPDPCTVDGDALQLGRALTNVIGNAVKFTPAGGEVTVSAVIEGTRLRISCRDTGIGIPEEDMDRLFTRFFRAGNATARTIPGTGLGLAIVKSIAQAHHGELTVRSTEGEGTTVVLELPVAAPPRS